MITIELIRARLSAGIAESGKTRTELAKALELSPAGVKHYIKGDRLPPLDTFATLCKEIDADPGYILGLTD